MRGEDWQETATGSDGQLRHSRELHVKGQGGAVSGNYFDRFRCLPEFKAAHKSKIHRRNNGVGVGYVMMTH